MAIAADLWELGLITSLFTILVLIVNNRYKRYRYGKRKKNDEINDDIELGSINTDDILDNNNSLQLSRDADDAPYGDENSIDYD